MKESNNALPYLFDENEHEVCEILLDLDNLIYQSRLPSKWGTKRRRSNIDAPPAPAPAPAAAAAAAAAGGGGGGGGAGQSAHHHHHIAASSSSTPSMEIASQKDDKVQKNNQDKVEATSPDTPLSFYPSESDDKSKHSLIKSSKKRTREELLEFIKELTQSRDVLRREVENVRSYYNKLKAFNMELKAIKQQITTAALRKQMPHPLNLVPNVGQQYQIPLLPHQIMALGSQTREENGMVNHMGPRGIPDLNVSAEEVFVVESSQPSNHGMASELSKAETAANRKIRKMLMAKKKNEQKSR